MLRWLKQTHVWLPMTSDLTYLGLRIPHLYLKITVPASAFRTRIPFTGFEMYQVPITHQAPSLG